MGKVILFPGGPHGPRATVRFLPARPARQMRLPLPPADAREQESADLELRIRAAKAMSAQHEEWMTTDPARRHVHARRAADWNQRVLDLIAERDRRTAQQDLLPRP